MRRAATIVLVVLQYKLYARQRPDTSWRLGIAPRRAGWLTRLQNAAEMTSSSIGYVDGYTVYRYTVHGSSVLVESRNYSWYTAARARFYSCSVSQVRVGAPLAAACPFAHFKTMDYLLLVPLDCSWDHCSYLPVPWYSTTTINQWFVLARQTDNNALIIISSHVDCCVETRTAEMGVPNLYRWLSERCTPPVVRPILPPQHASSGDLSHPLYFPTDAPFPSPCPPRLFTRSAH